MTVASRTGAVFPLARTTPVTRTAARVSRGAESAEGVEAGAAVGVEAGAAVGLEAGAADGVGGGTAEGS